VSYGFTAQVNGKQERRRSFVLNHGFTAPIVMALGGWKTEGMMRRYVAVTDQTLIVAVEAVSGAGTRTLANVEENTDECLRL
jgi:hypothetical protein